MPNKAIFFSFLRGNVPLFLSKTMPSAAAFRVSNACAFRSGVLLGVYACIFRLWKMAFKIRAAARSIIGSSKLPSTFASKSASHCFLVPGSIKSFPALICATASSPPNQSVMTKPSKPHSSRRISVSNSLLCEV